jgi:endogenous inhibitor of DNA gyrase (YacG/DUF329 family)
MTEPKPPAGPRGKCPICSRPTDTKYRPFCSRRCADVDLARWLRGSYAIPDAGESEDGDESSEGEGASPAAIPDKDRSGSTH